MATIGQSILTQTNLILDVDAKRNSSFNVNNLSASTEILIPIDTGVNLFVENLILNYRVNGNNDANRHWTYNLFKITNTFGWIFLTGGNTQANFFGSLNISLNIQDLASNNIAFYLLQLQRVGNAGQLNLSGRLNYRVTN